MPKIKCLMTGEIIITSEAPRLINGIWECGDQRFTDRNATMYQAVAEPVKVSPVEFKLLFTAPERVAIKASADPIVQDFFEIVNDPRLTFVDLGLQSTHDALAYLEGIGLIAEGRAAVILAGNFA